MTNILLAGVLLVAVPFYAVAAGKLATIAEPEGSWLVCRAEALAADSKTLLYMLSEPISLTTPGWAERIRTERSYRSALASAGGIGLENVTVTCATAESSPDAATARAEYSARQFSDDRWRRGIKLRRIPERWRLQGADLAPEAADQPKR